MGAFRSLFQLAVILVLSNSVACTDFVTVDLPPTVDTNPIMHAWPVSASVGGNVTDDGGDTVTVRGICWSTFPSPTIEDNKTTEGMGTGSFTSHITGLIPNTTYYFRAYATNSVATSYGLQVALTTSAFYQTGTFTDSRDGRLYKTVTIGTQTWMSENLEYQTASGSWYYNDDSSTYNVYGRLYNWENAMISAPPGWHIPSLEEWKTLITFLGGTDVAGGKLKEEGSGHWTSPNVGATNESGFTALPGGFRGYQGNFDDVRLYSTWWSADGGVAAWTISLGYSYANVAQIWHVALHGFNVRCVKD